MSTLPRFLSYLGRALSTLVTSPERGSASSRLQLQRIVQVWTVCLIGGYLNWRTFSPGVATPDSFSHIFEFQALQFRDQHPVSMPLVWGTLYRLTGTYESQFVLHIVLIWMVPALLAIIFRQSTRVWWVLVFPLLPWVINHSGMVWKDVFSAALFAVGAVLAFRKPSRATSIAVLLMWGVASTLRYNGIVILTVLAIGYGIFVLGSKRSRAVWIALFLVVSVALPSFFNAWAAPTPTNQQNHQAVDDLSYLSLRAGESLVPGRTLSEISGCEGYEKFGLRDNAYIRCLDGWGLGDQSLRKESLLPQWGRAIANNPFDYLAYRADKYWQFLGFDDLEPFYVYHPETSVPAADLHFERFGFDYRFEENPMSLLVHRAVRGAEQAVPLMFLPGFWLLYSLLGAITSAYLSSKVQPPDLRRRTKFLATVFGASFLYIAAYFPMVISADYKYVMAASWLSTVATIVGSLMFTNRPKTKI